MTIFSYTLKVSVEDSKDFSLPQNSPAERLLNVFPVNRGSVSIRLLELREKVNGVLVRRFEADGIFGSEVREVKTARRKSRTKVERRKKRPSTNMRSLHKKN